MNESSQPPIHERWAHLRFSVVGPLLAAPPARGELQAAREPLAATPWLHPVTRVPTRFGVSTIERWFTQARRARLDPVGVLRRKVRSDTANFHILLDPDYVFTNAYGLSWNAQNETSDPSTFVINEKRRVTFAKVSKTHGDRSEGGGCEDRRVLNDASIDARTTSV